MEILSNPYVALFAIIAIGLAFGNLRVKGLSFDSSAVIFAAFLFGYFGVSIPPIIQKIGLIFFIYSVGIQAGPGFFESFRKQGILLILITVIVIVSGALTTLISGYLFKIPMEISVGLFTGALTSTPGLAAAIESTQSPLASIGYGIAYPFGVLGVILFVKLINRIVKVDIPSAEQDYLDALESDFPKLLNQNYTVENPNIFNKSLSELHFRSMTNTNISRILQQGKASTPTPGTILGEGDIIKAVGTEEDLANVELLIGQKTDKQIPLGKKFVVRPLLVSNKAIVNKSFADLALFSNFNATATSIRRSGIDISPQPQTKIKYGDKIKIACAEEDIEGVAKLFGNDQKAMVELDFMAISIGIIFGILVGMISIPFAGYDFRLGLTGGVLIASLVLSKLGRTGPILWNVSGESNQLLRQIGLLFFLASVGTNAGANIVETVAEHGYSLLFVGAAITLIPMVITIIVGHYLLKINFLTLLGALTGSMTSTPALSSLDSTTNSNAPKVAYATVYPFALVILIVITQLLVSFL